ncbi:MAG: hypothetical protein A4S17_06470 [Proteobacteria bacterium HN_bin10]|nr:MAG: hypothetical protein A4S17_06470 [Proteobacteria bacterium HN_bin10]
MADYDPQQRTRTLARIAGPYMLVIGATLLTRQSSFSAILPDFMADPGLVLSTGAFTLIVGLCILAAHHHWSSPAAIAITLMGFAAAIKGAWLMIAPDWGADATEAIVATPSALTAAAAFELLLGAWLTAVGWFAKRPA